MTQAFGGDESIIKTGVIRIVAKPDKSENKAAASEAASAFAKTFTNQLKRSLDFEGVFRGGTNDARRAGKDAGDAYSTAFKRNMNTSSGGGKSFIGNLFGGDSKSKVNKDVEGLFSGLGGAVQKAFGNAGDVAAKGIDMIQKGFDQLFSGGSDLTKMFGDVGGQAGKMGGSLGEAGASVGTLGEAMGAASAAGSIIAGVYVALGAVFMATAAAATAFTAAAVIAGAVTSAVAFAAAALGGAMAALPGVLGAAAAGLGAVFLVAKPLVDALQAFTSAQDGATASSQKSAKAQVSNASAIRAAKQAISDAVQSQADTQSRGAKSIADSEKQAADAADNSAKAQKNLNEERRAAARDIEDLNAKVADLANDQTAADIAVTNAQLKLQSVQEKYLPSAVELKQAQLELAQAENKVTDVQLEKKRTQEELTKVNKTGVEGTARVITATDQYKKALESEKTAQDNVKVARTQAAKDNAQAAQMVVRAKQQLADANVKTAQSEGATSTATNNLTSALNKLSPAGLAFFDILKGFPAVLDGVSKSVQDKMLPQLTPLLTTVKNLFGEFKNGKFVLGPLGKVLTDAGKVIGDLGDKFNTMLKGDTGKALMSLLQSGVDAIKSLGDGGLDFIKKLVPALATLAAAAKPVIDAFSTGFGDVGSGLGDMLTELSKSGAMKGFASAITAIFKVIGKSLPLVGRFIDTLSEIGGPSFASMGDTLVTILDSVFTMFEQMANSGVIDAFATVFQMVGEAFKRLSDSGVITLLGTAFAKVMEALAPSIPLLVDALIPALPALIDGFTNLTTQFILLLPQIIPLVPQIIDLVTTLVDDFLPYLPVLNQAFIALTTTFIKLIEWGIQISGILTDGIIAPWIIAKDTLSFVWTWLKANVFNPIGTFFTKTIPGWAGTLRDLVVGAWDGMKTKLSDGWTWIKNNVFTPVKDFITKTIPDAFTSGVTAIGKAWDKIKAAAATPVNFVIDTVYNNGIVALWNKIISKVPGVDELKPVAKLKFATGGLVPGVGHGDTVPAMLTPGEGILTKGEMKKIGGRKGFEQLRSQIQYFSDGGVVGWLKKTAGDVGGFVKDKLGSPVRGALAGAFKKGADALVHPLVDGMPSGLFGSLGKGMGNKTIDSAYNWLKGDDKKHPLNAGGGTKEALISFGRWLVGKGYAVSEHPAFGGVTPGGHTDGSLHYTGDAIDINHGSGTSAKEQGYLRDVLDDAHGAGLRTIFMAPGHYNHLHVDDGNGASIGQIGGDRNGNQYSPAAVTGGGTTGSAQAFAKSVLGNYGWDNDQWASLKELWTGESNWRTNATNRSSGAYGIPQALPGSKMASAGRDWRTNPNTQIKWGMDYIKGRYGTPANAYSTWKQRSPHWYDNGGPLPEGFSTVFNGSGKPETVLNPAQGKALEDKIQGIGGGGDTYHITLQVNADEIKDVQDVITLVKGATKTGRSRNAS